MSDNKKYIIIESPRHSWLRVSLSELEEFGILADISPFSYTDGEFAYLEEDLDMGTFLEKREEMIGKPIDWGSEIERQYVDDFPHLPIIRPIE